MDISLKEIDVISVMYESEMINLLSYDELSEIMTESGGGLRISFKK